MSSDPDSNHPDQKRRAAGVPTGQDKNPSLRGVPLTTVGLCGLAMILVASGMRSDAAEEWWMELAPAGVLILILYMWMSQERWLTRERHRLIVSALKRTGALDSSLESKEKATRRTRTRRGGKPVEKGSSRSTGDEPARLGDGRAPPDSPHASGRGAARKEVQPEGRPAEVPPKEAEKRAIP